MNGQVTLTLQDYEKFIAEVEHHKKRADESTKKHLLMIRSRYNSFPEFHTDDEALVKVLREMFDHIEGIKSELNSINRKIEKLNPPTS